MTTTYTNHEDMQEPPKRQTATSMFKMFIGSLPASILMAWAGSWLGYATLPPEAAQQFMFAVVAACLVTGGGSTLINADGLKKRSLNLTEWKRHNAVVQETASINAAPEAAAVSDSAMYPEEAYVDDEHAG